MCICVFARLTQGILILVAMLISWQAFDKSIWWLAHLVIFLIRIILFCKNQNCHYNHLRDVSVLPKVVEGERFPI